MKFEDSKADLSVTTNSLGPSQESLPLPPPAYRRTWGNDVALDSDTKRQCTEIGWGATLRGTARDCYDAGCRRGRETVRVLFRRTFWVGIPKEQYIALFLVIIGGIVPLIILGSNTMGNSGQPFFSIFKDKVLGCGIDTLGSPQNATVTGIEKLFVLDSTYGRFSFSQAKTIDVLWDLFVGRGVQLVAWWISYRVFSDALLRLIERKPASFRIFQRIALEGPSLHSLWTLVKEVWRARDRKTTVLFCYLWLSTAYVLCIPVFLGAMTGYDATSIAWLDIDNTNNIIPWYSMKEAWIIEGAAGKLLEPPICKPTWMMYEGRRQTQEKFGQCECQFPNGTIFDTVLKVGPYWMYGYEDCNFEFSNNRTFGPENWWADQTPKRCNSSFLVNVQGRDYSSQDVWGTWGYCFNDVGYNSTYLYDKSRCLPDTANPAYQWGFATMLSSLFIFFNFAWALSMYLLWQDAQINCTIVQSGYQMTPLRAAFVMARAARRKTGMGEKELIRADTKELEREMYGAKTIHATQVDHDLFMESEIHPRRHHPYNGEEYDLVQQRCGFDDLEYRRRRGLAEADASKP